MKTVIIVDDDDTEREAAASVLRSSYLVVGVRSVAAASAALREGAVPSVILADEASAGGLEGLEALRAHAPSATLILARPDGPDAQERAPQAEPGRSDPLSIRKPYAREELRRLVRLASASAGAPEHPGSAAGDATRGLIGSGPLFEALRKRIRLFAESEAPVLILGESGTGKELAAAAIHRGSRRRSRRFVPVDCAALPDTLAESALFGTVRGAFTDAVESRGAFEAAKGGTLFLDEIGELRPRVQAKFLRTLESGSGYRVGSLETVRYDVRLVSATNAPLASRRRRFRPELLHRIDTLVLEMPPLREHKEDIQAISEHILQRCREDKRLEDKALQRLMTWDWPGNVRELRNVLQRAAVLSGGESVIRPVHVELGYRGRAWQASLF